MHFNYKESIGCFSGYTVDPYLGGARFESRLGHRLL
jgi:hypothetical protein